MTTLTKRMPAGDDALYCRYQTQTERQPVRLCLNLETGELSAAYWPEIGGGRTMRAFHRRDLEWTIPPLRVRALAALMDDVEGHAQTILDHAVVEWDGSDFTGRLDDEAELAADAIDALIDRQPWDETDTWEPWDAGDYLFGAGQGLDDLGLSPQSTEEEIEAAAARLVEEADVVLDVDDVECELRHRVEQERADDDDAE